LTAEWWHLSLLCPPAVGLLVELLGELSGLKLGQP
jgi:hypothetical protein